MSARGQHGLLLSATSGNFAAYMASLLPVAWWRMDDAIGSTFLNDSIANEQAILSGSNTLKAAGLVTGDSDTAVAFTSSGYAATAGKAKWALGTSDFSAFIIAKWTATALAVPASVRDSGSSNILCLFTANRVSVGDVGCEAWNWNTQKINVAGSYNNGNKHALGLTYNASTNTLRFYLDGVMEVAQVQSGPYSRPTASTMSAVIGANSNLQFLGGTEDEYALFNRQLSDTEMANIASLALTGSLP